jgi:hypothetical protein
LMIAKRSSAMAAGGQLCARARRSGMLDDVCQVGSQPCRSKGSEEWTRSEVL